MEEIKGKGGAARAYGADVADNNAVKAMIEAIVRDFGGLGIVVNNAGFAIQRRFLDTTEQEWKRQIDTCLYGVIHMAHAAAPHLMKSGGGRVIALTKSLARELGRSGVTANVVSLGLVETAPTWALIEANRDMLEKLYPLRRLSLAEDIAPMVALLASPKASWITGQVISVSGGFSGAASLVNPSIARRIPWSRAEAARLAGMSRHRASQ